MIFICRLSLQNRLQHHIFSSIIIYNPSSSDYYWDEPNLEYKPKKWKTYGTAHNHRNTNYSTYQPKRNPYRRLFLKWKRIRGEMDRLEILIGRPRSIWFIFSRDNAIPVDLQDYNWKMLIKSNVRHLCGWREALYMTEN